MTIGFEQIALKINTPGVFVEFDPSRALSGVQLAPHDTIVIGQKLAAGTATVGQIYAVASEAEAIALFGNQSQLHQQIVEYKRIDPLTPVFACAPAADSGTAASDGTIVFTGTATEAGEIVMYIGGRRVVVAVAVGDTSADVETNAVAALDLVAEGLPVTYAADGVVDAVDFTARQAGTIGNQILLGVCLLPGERIPAGLTAVATPFSNGATDPAYTAAVTAMGEDQYSTVVSGLASDTALSALEAEMESRWGPMRQIEGQIFAGLYDTRANLSTAGNARNSFASTVVGGELSAVLPLPWELAAQAAALSARRAQVDPSRALTGASFSGFTAAPRGARFTRAERDILLSDGISTVYAGSDGRLRLERFVTTWQTNAASLADESYKDLTTVRLLAALRYSVRARILSRFSQHKLMSDGALVPAGQPVVTPSIMRSEMIALFLDWQDLAWVEGLEQFKAELVVERDLSDSNRINMLLPPDLVNNLLVTAAKISFKR